LRAVFGTVVRAGLGGTFEMGEIVNDRRTAMRETVVQHSSGELAAEHFRLHDSDARASDAQAPIRTKPRGWIFPALLAASDLLALLVAFALSQFVSAAAVGDGALGALFLCSLPVWLVGFKTAGLYDRDLRLINHTAIDEISDLTRVTALCTSLLLVATWAIDPSAARIGQMTLFWITGTVALLAFRAVARIPLHHDSRFRQNTLIVGAGNVGQLLGVKILQHPEYRLNLVGFVDRLPKERREELEELTIVGSPEDLPDLIRSLDVDRVVFAFSNDSTEEISQLIRLLKDCQAYVDLVPRLFDVIPPGLTGHAIEGIPLISLPGLRLSQWSRILKRSLDLTVACGLMAVLAPLFILIAVLTRFDSPGPIFFRQLRMGADEQPFWILKFRTMVMGADARKEEIAHLNKHAGPGGDARMFKIVGDPRVTRFGRLLRRYSLDELPQLINVIRGQMSLVGPRPLILDEDRYVEAWGRTRLALKPGITGLWQVSGRSSIPFEEMVKLDYLYVTSWSLSNDCRLLLQTLPIVFRGDAP
jgi:exopolysaccharide biosynthesis polyprenyl glycosylphosphotransferase